MKYFVLLILFLTAAITFFCVDTADDTKFLELLALKALAFIMMVVCYRRLSTKENIALLLRGNRWIEKQVKGAKNKRGGEPLKPIKNSSHDTH